MRSRIPLFIAFVLLKEAIMAAIRSEISPRSYRIYLSDMNPNQQNTILETCRSNALKAKLQTEASIQEGKKKIAVWLVYLATPAIASAIICEIKNNGVTSFTAEPVNEGPGKVVEKGPDTFPWSA
jgi:hypothetical protein